MGGIIKSRLPVAFDIAPRQFAFIVHRKEVEPAIVEEFRHLRMAGEHLEHCLARGFDRHRKAQRVVLIAMSVMDGLPRQPAFETHRLAEQPVSIVGTPQRLDPKKPIAALLREQPFILPTGDNSVRTAFDALASRLAVRPQIVAEVDDMAMMRLLAREDIGLALVAPVVVKDELANGRLVEALDHPQIRETFYAITLRRRFPNPLVQQLLGAGSAPETIDNSQRS